jgi:FkbM family methyltransferase
VPQLELREKVVFVSYAQNFEDVMLHRVFEETDGGFYIDVGAAHPDLHSVTKHFYERGWSGINIEPAQCYFGILRKQRGRDINLDVAVGNQAGEMDFVEVPGSGLSSLQEDTVARAHRRGFSSRQYKVPVVTLQSVCEQYCPGRPISFLKIDVEGSERIVVESLQWQVIRPILVLVEAVHPDTLEPMWDAWEPILLRAGYLFVWFDGLNRYYLRHESSELKKHFLIPPGLADHFVIKSSHPLCMRMRTRIRLALRETLPLKVYNSVLAAYDSVNRSGGGVRRSRRSHNDRVGARY